MKNLKVIILAWWIWSRLWPISRETSPKQFSKIKELNHRSLFQMTLERAINITDINNIYVVVSKEHFFHAEIQSEEIWNKIPKENIIIQPSVKETLPIIALTTQKIWKWNILVLPSDHLIENNNLFFDSINDAYKNLEKWIVLFWVKPEKPETWYWYIEKEKKNDYFSKIKNFHEKPNKEKAIKYIENWYLWNSWIFFYSYDVFLKELEKHNEKMKKLIFDKSLSDEDKFKKVEAISIDHWLIEKSDNIYCQKINYYWNDLGSFDALWDYLLKKWDHNKNYISEWKVENNIVLSENKNKEIALIDVSNLIIVDDNDVLLIAEKWSSQKVKKILDKSNKISWDLEYRPWWYSKIIAQWNWYRTKKIMVLPSRKLSLQSHNHRSEHWIVVNWTWKATIWDNVKTILTWESVFVNAWEKHKLENPWKIPLIIIESQIWNYLWEDDIARYDDDFWRK